MAGGIGVHTRKRLWARARNCCAFPGCTETLLEPVEGADEDTVVGNECHIVAREDSPAVARSVSSLTAAEHDEFAQLIADRHNYANLILLCARHSLVIDDPNGPYDIARVVAMKRDHERAMDAARTSADRRAEDVVLRYAAIVDQWERRVALDQWQRWVGPVFGDGHPRMRREDFDRLTATRKWMFSRVWPGTEPTLEDAFENFRRVAQDLQLTLEQYPHEELARRGLVAPTRFYNDIAWQKTIGDQPRLDAMYEWYANLLEDLAIELTRAANLVCEAVRQTIDARYRLEEGLIVLESGPYTDFMTRLHRPRYKGSDGWLPYPGLRPFLTVREDRDEHRGSGDVPEGLRLPGDDPFS
ncbi:MAG: hypothetical protein V7607_2631 [Solirubrobacteraceae bacterium]